MAEVFGYGLDDFSPEAVKARADRSCPFLKGRCRKDNEGKTGTCSIRHGDEVVITCPHRFSQDGQTEADIKNTCFPRDEPVRFHPEVRLGGAGNIDYVAQSERNPDDYVAVERQATYIQGNITKPFLWYMKGPAHALADPIGYPKKSWPTPDFRSGGAKRLFPQLQVKGQTIVTAWGKREVVVLDRPLFDSILKPLAGKPLPTVSPDVATLIWFVYRLDEQPSGSRKMVLDQTVFTDLDVAMATLNVVDAGDEAEWLSELERRPKAA
jgi:hypothetical protein